MSISIDTVRSQKTWMIVMKKMNPEKTDLKKANYISNKYMGMMYFFTMVMTVGLLTMIVQSSCAQQPPTETIKTAKSHTPEQQEIINLSKKKWDWMADKNVDSLKVLFDDKAMFVHMGGTWGKTQELATIKSGGIWYKKAVVYGVEVNIFDNTAILLNDIDLQAVVGRHEVTNPFMVTEVYIKENGKWKMGSLTFSHLLRPVKMNTNNN